MERTSKPPIEIKVESSRVSMTPVKLVALISAVVMAATFATNLISRTATKKDVVTAISDHKNGTHPETARRLNAVEVSNVVQNAKLDKLEGVPEEISAVKARVNMLVYEAANTPQREPAIKEAAREVRKAAKKRGEKKDPLAGMKGL